LNPVNPVHPVNKMDCRERTQSGEGATKRILPRMARMEQRCRAGSGLFAKNE
jgi:hypothetical protein